MTFYRFLAAGAMGPFSGRRWPTPIGGPAAWVVAGDAIADGPDGSRVCGVAQLPYWIADELWRVEVDGALTESATDVTAPRVRLVERVVGWNGDAGRDWATTSVWRGRDALAARLAADGHLDEAAQLHATMTLAPLSELATRQETALANEINTELADQLGVLGEAADEAEHAWVATALQSSMVAVAGWSPAGQLAERAWQAAWLAERLGLDES